MTDGNGEGSLCWQDNEFEAVPAHLRYETDDSDTDNSINYPLLVYDEGRCTLENKRRAVEAVHNCTVRMGDAFR